MHLIAKELAGSDELGLDEQTLLKLFDIKTDNLLGLSTGPFSNQFTFEDHPHGLDQVHLKHSPYRKKTPKRNRDISQSGHTGQRDTFLG